MDNNKSIICSNIKERRIERGWTQTQLADKVGTSQQQINRIENFQKPHAPLLKKIADALDCHVSDLIDIPEKSEKPLIKNEIRKMIKEECAEIKILLKNALEAFRKIDKEQGAIEYRLEQLEGKTKKRKKLSGGRA